MAHLEAEPVGHTDAVVIAHTGGLADADTGRPSFLGEGALTAEAVAACALQGLQEGRFLILPHAEVLGFFQRKAADYDRWLRGMRRLRDKVVGQPGAQAR